jgi:hypothetical protein
MSDLRFAFRILAKTPGFTALAVATLAIGIGASTIVFSGLNALLFRPKSGAVYLWPRAKREIQRHI